MPCVPDVPSVGAISAPRALKRTANKEEPSPPRRIRASLTDGRVRTPLHPNLLNTSSPRKFREIGATADSEMVDSRSPLREGAMAVLDDKVSGGNTRIHLPRTQASLSSLLDEAHRQSKSSQNSGSERSRHSVAEYCPTRRWSWRALINGPGFSFGQNGIGTGKNRLSADTSSMNHWPEENPSVSIGYAYSGIDEESRGNGSQTEAPEVDVSLLYPQDYFSYCEEDADAGQHGEPLEEPEEIR
ncbi:hypothetical protein DFH11DRAFT_983943 [Phellopilus nigrolimitatus]|nr:hypothetical protein DFH11DRAFT_983943 [Phellopilus nigrolimitatus]